VLIKLDDGATGSVSLPTLPAPTVTIDTVLPTPVSVVISPAEARAGDTIRLEIRTLEAVTRSVTIAGKQANCPAPRPGTFVYLCTVSVTLDDAAIDKVPFTITLTDLAGNQASTSDTTNDSGSKIIKTVSSIALTATNTAGAPAYKLKPGEVLTLTVLTNEAVDLPTATFAGQDASCTSVTTTRFECTRTMLLTEPLGPIALSLLVRGITYTATTDGSSGELISPFTVTISSSNAVANLAKPGDAIIVRVDGGDRQRRRKVITSILGRRGGVVCTTKWAEPGALFCRVKVRQADVNGPAVFSIQTRLTTSGATTTTSTATTDGR
jgi:hypothetical protein